MCKLDVIHHSFSDHSLVQTVIYKIIERKAVIIINHGNHVMEKFRSFENFKCRLLHVNDLNGVDWNIHDSVPVGNSKIPKNNSTRDKLRLFFLS